MACLGRVEFESLAPPRLEDSPLFISREGITGFGSEALCNFNIRKSSGGLGNLQIFPALGVQQLQERQALCSHCSYSAPLASAVHKPLLFF
jgi:hypothetical protein